MTLNELQALQEAAGAAYAEAARAYRAAWCELHAVDLALANSNVGGGDQPTFNGIPAVMVHPRFLPSDVAAVLNGAETSADVSARLHQLLRSFNAAA